MTDLAPLPRTARATRVLQGPVAGGTVTIGCVVAACNDEESIGRMVESMLRQTRVPDVIHVVVHDADDATVEVAAGYAGPHEVVAGRCSQFTEVFVHDIGDMPRGRVDALEYGRGLVEGHDYVLTVDGRGVADAGAVERLEAEVTAAPRRSAMGMVLRAGWLIVGLLAVLRAVSLIEVVARRPNASGGWGNAAPGERH